MLKNSTTCTANVLKNGTVNINRGSRRVAAVKPEIFTDGWAKNTVAVRRSAAGYQGIIPLPGGEQIGLQTAVKAEKTAIRFRFSLTPLSDVKVIHVRLVINLPFEQWLNSPYQLGSRTGIVPATIPVDVVLAEADSTELFIGPSPIHKDLTLRVKSPGLRTVLQDNRQWTPFLHAFVAGFDRPDPPWEWKSGQKKVYDFTIAFNNREQ